MVGILSIFLLINFETTSKIIKATPSGSIYALHEPIPDSEYIIGPGDRLEILLKDIGISYSVLVDLNGKISLLLPIPDFVTQSMQNFIANTSPTNISILDFKKVFGLTLAELKDSLSLWYSKYYKGKSFDVRLLDPRIQNIFVYGKVNIPGAKTGYSTMRVTDILQKSNGCPYNANISKIKIYTIDGKEKILNLREFYRKGDYSQNPLIASIKKIWVPAIEKGIVVVGAVKGFPVITFGTQKIQALSGNFVISFDANVLKVATEDSLKVRDILDLAGGTKTYALLDEIYSARKGKVTLDTYISEGDTLYIPPFTDKVFVAGEVKNPQPVPYLPGADISTYISYCGGYTERASRKPIVYRANKKLKHVKEIKPGDIIYVKPVTFKWWQDYVQILQIFTTVVVTWLTLSK